MTAIDTNSPTWRFIAKWADVEIEKNRDILEHKDVPESRGRIAALRDLLKLPQPRKVPTATKTDYLA